MRIAALHIFLTYPVTDLTTEEVLNFLRSKTAPTYTIEKYCIARELHSTGEPHIHALLKFTKKIEIRDATRYFDLGTRHPNIQVPRRVLDVLKYIKKDGNFIEDWPLTKTWDAIVTSKSKEEFWANIKEQHPKEYLLNMEKLEYASKQLFKEKTEFISPWKPTDFQVHPLMSQWVTDLALKKKGHRMKALVIVSADPCVGKTSWARSIGSHIHLTGTITPHDVTKEGATYVILDDLYRWDFPFLKPYIGCQERVNIVGKYFKPRTINWDIPAIVTTNEEFWEEYSPSNKEYFRKMTTIIHIRNTLF